MELVWQFYQNNFERIKKMLANASPSLMDACIVYSCGGFAHESKAQEVEQFFKEHPLPRNTRKVSNLGCGLCYCFVMLVVVAVCDVLYRTRCLTAHHTHAETLCH
jgi:ERAP1-like C-terminal domain